MSDLIKKPNAKTSFEEQMVIDLALSADDPFYFIETFMKVQHPTRGSLPLKLYPFQRKLVEAFHTNSKVVALCGRQLGKCSTFDTKVSYNGQQVAIGNLVQIGRKQRIIAWLENKLIKLSLR